MGQSTRQFEQKWLEERRKMITASSVGLIAKRQPTTKVSSKVKQLLYSKISWKQGYGLGLISRGC